MSTELALGNDDGYAYYLIEFGEDSEASAKFAVHKVTAWTMDKKVAETELFLRGWIKWDGCSEITFGQDGDGLIHFCGKSSYDDLGNVMREVWEMCSKKISVWNEELATR